MADRPIPDLSFDDFLTFAELEAFSESLVQARPEICSAGSLGSSREGRPLILLTLTDRSTGEAHEKPAYLVHANIHATELAGTHMALYTARRLLIEHGESDLLKRVAFYIVPRLNPDGAEQVIGSNMRIRSRLDNSRREANTLYQEDVDGDGLVLQMRREGPDGTMVADPEDPRLLIPRRAGDEGPFYRVWPEGVIHNWDGSDGISVDGRSYDWNRNWSYDWRPEPEQPGAGDHPFSEQEMRHLAEFLHSHPSIFAVLGYHTGPNAVLRPPSTGSLQDLDPEDDQVIEDLAREAAALTGFPVTPVVQYHNARSRDINLRGHFHNFGYNHLGLFVYEFELGVFMNSAGIPTDEIFATRSDEEMEALERRMMAFWDEGKRDQPLFVPWSGFRHPQLGDVEIGGFIHRYRSNPALNDLERIAAATHRFTLHHAGKHPAVRIEDVAVERVDDDTWRVRARVANRGELPTHVTNRGRGLRRLEPVKVTLHCAEEVTLLSRQAHYNLGHMSGRIGSADLEWFLHAPETRTELCRVDVSAGTGGCCSHCVCTKAPDGPVADHGKS